LVLLRTSLAFNRTVVLRYRIYLEQKQYAATTINLRLAAVRRVAYEAADSGLLSPELAAGIRRVKGVRRIGVRIGNWLTAEQSKRLLAGADRESILGKRNYAMLAILIGCGLRRGELLALRVNSIQVREEHWVIADLLGKAGHIRTVPVPAWVKAGVDEWKNAAGITDGALFRSINKTGRVWGTGMTPKVLWEIVREAASRAGIEKLAPHDLGRSCARLCHLAGGELDQIQFLLGHVSIQTTERYLGSPTFSRPIRPARARAAPGAPIQQFGRRRTSAWSRTPFSGYSSLSALTGFTPAARRAGRYAAT
jgi:integrase